MADPLDDLERRLENWVRWRLGSSRSGLGFPSASSITKHGMPVERYARDSGVPCLSGEAQDLDCCISRLKPELRSILDAHYVRWPLATANELAGLLQCSRNTVANRLKAARATLRDMLAGERVARSAASRSAGLRLARAFPQAGADD